MGGRGRGWGREGSPGLSEAWRGEERGPGPHPPLPHLSREQQKGGEGRAEENPRGEPGGKLDEQGRREGSTWPRRICPPPRPCPVPSSRRPRRGTAFPDQKGRPGGGKRPPSPLPMLGAPRGEAGARRLLQQLQQEAGRAPRSCPSGALTRRGGASICPRRSSDCPVCAAREEEAAAVPGAGPRPRLPRQRLSHPGSLPQGDGTCRFFCAAGCTRSARQPGSPALAPFKPAARERDACD